MKNKPLLITAITFFLLVNSVYFWEGRLGGYAIPATMVLLTVYLILVFSLIRQLLAAIKDKFADRRRLFTGGVLLAVLVLTSYKPSGLINFEKLEATALLVAEKEGAANCTTVLKLKDDLTFKERNVCFGVFETRGSFRVQQDTIFFEHVTTARGETSYYRYAVIRMPKPGENRPEGWLVRFTDLTDTTGNPLWITQNELSKLKAMEKLGRAGR